MKVEPAPVVSVNQFEGPLALLLELVEHNQMSVTDIAVAAITSQYLARVSRLDGLSPEALADFLQLGSRLNYIKSLALLPASEPDIQGDELRQLGRELAEYQRYQAAAKSLAERAKHPTWVRPVSAKLAGSDMPLPTLALTDLAVAFQAALRQMEPEASPHRLKAEISQADVISRLHQRLKGGAFELGSLLSGLRNRMEVIVTFTALLELIRSGAGHVTQAGQFEPIMIGPAL